MNNSIDALVTKFRSQPMQAGVTSVKGWKEKTKQWFTAYMMAADIIMNGVPADPRIQEIQLWLNDQYKFIDGLDTSQPGWKDAGISILAAKLKTFAEYRARLWRAALQLFEGGRDPSFVSTFARSIDVELTKAWNEGARTLGIEPDEMTDRDMKVLTDIIANENDFILRIAGDIQAARDAGMDPEQFERQFGNRVNVWANRYTDVVNQALLYWGKKERLEWKLGNREEHCSTCPRLAGIVAFGDEWSRVGFHPQRPPNGKLECGGWNCGCTLVPTKKRRTTNAIKKLRAIG